MLSTRALQQFLVVADELHFGRAARRLHMSQPPLSQAIMRLEDVVGVALFDRANRSVTLTEAGAVFADEARRLIAQEEMAIAHARQASAGVSGTVRLGFVGSVSYGLLPDLLMRLRASLPGVALDLRELPSGEQVRALQALEIDIGIVRTPLADAHDLELRVIHRERLMAVLPRDHRLAAQPAVHLHDLREETFMMFPPERVLSLYAKTLLACQVAGFSPKVGLEAWQMPTMVSLVAAHVGVALLPEQIAAIPHGGVVYRPIAEDIAHLDLDICLAWPKSLRSQACQRVIARIVDA